MYIDLLRRVVGPVSDLDSKRQELLLLAVRKHGPEWVFKLLRIIRSLQYMMAIKYSPMIGRDMTFITDML